MHESRDTGMVIETKSGEKYPDPLQYLNRVERALFGWMVVRMFVTNTSRFAKWVKDSGPEAVAHTACGRVLLLYGFGFMVLAIFGQIVRVDVIAYVFYGLVGVCAVWAFVCLLLALGPQREFRRIRQGS
jgi:hypothetical protein